ncbi:MULTISPECIES: polyhydroxyalkanoic acid system family protein [unclassified Duganella]|uniref:polyhydroxyalkanoic acid system family protein n=1 Tax=unclassified Duganella TaxID=2636909 RepID=UPI0008852B1A|nr:MULTISPECIES: polyhydroxyalkanoic acid system family protein [unclassified Duganella]SDH03110.1 putative polyhydroxyalkanoic acid system protein [Duganella sp. OV458]SDK22990.1 putative polyhydroxyalkanoic acid system protein [Duganella sp. OV510]
MADINIVQQHTLAPEQARAAAQQVADKLAEQFDLACRWDGDVLRFERNGVNGALTLQPNQAQIQIALGFPISMMASQVEAKVSEKMRKLFAAI